MCPGPAARRRQVCGLVDVAQGACVGVQRAPLVLRKHPDGQAIHQCPEPPLALGEQAPGRIGPRPGTRRKRQLLTAPVALEDGSVGG